MTDGVQQVYRMAAAAIVWFALGLQFVLIVHYETDGDLLAGALRFVSYFTLLSNLLVALAMTLPWLAPGSRLGCFFLEPSVGTAILAYITIAAVIYHVPLRKLWNPQGWGIVLGTVSRDRIVPI